MAEPDVSLTVLRPELQLIWDKAEIVEKNFIPKGVRMGLSEKTTDKLWNPGNPGKLLIDLLYMFLKHVAEINAEIKRIFKRCNLGFVFFIMLIHGNL